MFCSLCHNKNSDRGDTHLTGLLYFLNHVVSTKKTVVEGALAGTRTGEAGEGVAGFGMEKARPARGGARGRRAGAEGARVAGRGGVTRGGGS